MCLFFFLRYFAFLVTYFCSWKSIFNIMFLILSVIFLLWQSLSNDKYLSFFLWYFYFWQSVSNVRYLSFFLWVFQFSLCCLSFSDTLFSTQQSISNVIVLSFLSLILWFWHNVYLMLVICHSVSDIFILNKVHPMLIYFTFFLMSLVLTKS